MGDRRPAGPARPAASKRAPGHPDGLTFVLEVGCEEIPALLIPKALEDLAAALMQALGPLAAGASAARDLGGPRRLVARITGIRDREADREETVTGPPRSAAFDAAGRPNAAAAGFARAQGVGVSDLRVVAGAKGEVVAATKRVRGRAAAEVLSEACPRVLQAMRFGKTMRWGDRGYVFVRPVHWILALLDAEVVPFEFTGVRSGRATHGHRYLGAGPHEVARASDYEIVLRERGGVVVGAEERRREILVRAAREATAAGGILRPDSDLVEELVFLTEHPAVVGGSFPEEYLALPEPVLLTTMRRHQKYLTVEKAGGGLLNAFVAVLTTDADPAGLIRRGNEWVLRARLADARFFFEEDRKRRLEERSADLARVMFHARLGSYAQKIDRLSWILDPAVDLLGPAGVRSDEERRDLSLALRLCKADLTTGMVGEFPELQGVMGGIYARLEGHPEACARAIEEHYLPLSAAGSVPSKGPAAVLALADKIDTLALCFTAGMVPKGSADPLGLRRIAMGVLRILIENQVRTDLGRLLDRAMEEVEGHVTPLAREASAARPEPDERKSKEAGARAAPPVPVGTGSGAGPGPGKQRSPGAKARAETLDPRAALHEFVKQRLQFLMEESGVRFDAARAALAAGWSDPLLAWRRARALHTLRGQDDFLALAAAAKRVRNILAQAGAKGMGVDGSALVPSRLAAGAEADLFEAMRRAAGEVDDLAAREDHRGALCAIAALRPRVDRFFDEVLVMDPDAAVRSNRLALLAELSRLLSREADFAEIVVEGEPPA